MSVPEPMIAGASTDAAAGPLRVAVDPDICQGHARCWQVCPEIFGLDEEGHAVVAATEVPPELAEKVQEAMDNCPERAITLN